MLPVIGALRPWVDPTQLAIGRLPMRAALPAAPDARRVLDGEWCFRLFESPDDVPPAAVHGSTPQSGRQWRQLAVPGNWTMQIGDDLPQYTNVQMPFPGPPPRLPERNPTGVYRRSFRVGRGWHNHRVVLHVGGAESVHAVYLNDAFVGYGTDSRLPSEYDVTDHVRGGDNHLAIVVMRWSAHSYVEDQDQWWMAGLHRSVWIEARPHIGIGDLVVEAGWDVAAGSGSLTVRTEVTTGAGAAPLPSGYRVRAWLERVDGRRVGRAQLSDVPHVHAAPYVFEGHVATATWGSLAVAPWSAESPTLYRVRAELLRPDGGVVDEASQRVGFRSVEVRDRELLVNGRRVWIFGVNRHDHHPDRGKAVTAADMRDDLVAMRRLNVNAIRTSHYPPDPALLDLCDELGFYVVDEANVESHAYNRTLCDDARYRAAWVDRGARMVTRDRNHPSVIVWSLGNESGYGSNHDALAGWIRTADPTRPLHYEDAVRIDGWVDGGRVATDIVCPMYADIESVREYGAAGLGERPLILCEYNHAMGNSNGSLADYWDVITSTPGLQGGFLWEWKDHGLRQRLADGTTRLAYGGQFGDAPNDCNFVADGVMSSDLEPHPAAAELAWVHRPVTVAAARGGLRIENRQSFVGLGWLLARWELSVDGEVTGAGVLSVPDVAPHGGVTVALPRAVPPGRGEALLTIRWEARRDQWFAPAGHLVAWDQVVLRRAAARRRPAIGGDPAPLMSSRPRLNLWRAATDNDGFKLMPELSLRLGVGGTALARWLAAGLDRRDPETMVAHEVDVQRLADGSHRYRHVVTVPDALADLPRVGVTFAVPARLNRMRWFGRGPHECYPDRQRSAVLGTWEKPIDRPPYLVPQEFGLRTDCRWFELLDPTTGEVLRIEPESPMHVSATRFAPSDLFVARHECELVPRDEVVVCVDAAHRGLGTASCGPDVLDRYRLPAGRYEFAYRLSARTVS